MRAVIPYRHKLLILFALVLLFQAQSCVSKRKFVEMTNQRTLAEKRVVALSEGNEILKNDFESYKIESQKELTLKQLLIDSLRSTIASMNTDMISEKGNIEDQTFTFQVEQGKLSQQLVEKDKEIRNLTRDINTLTVQIDDLKRELDNAKSGFKFPFGNVKQLERKIQSKDKEIASLDSSLNSAKQEILLLNEKIALQAITIGKLSTVKDSSNQVNQEK